MHVKVSVWPLGAAVKLVGVWCHVRCFSFTFGDISLSPNKILLLLPQGLYSNKGGSHTLLVVPSETGRSKVRNNFPGQKI